MKQQTTLIASSPSSEALLKQIQSYFYSTNIFVNEAGEVHNSTGAINNFRVKKGAGRWRFERIHQDETK